MKAAAVALRNMFGIIVAGVGLEGAFLLLGTALLAYASSAISPYGPPAVVGLVSILAGLALAITPRKV